jgi:inner membrane protein
MTTENTIIEKVNNWIKNSVTLKLVIITILTLLLLIPTLMIKDIINEREELSNQAIEEVSSKWAESQQLNGPILTIPLIYEYNENDKIVMITKYWHLLPENLKIDGKIEPEILRRGIYEVVVYKSKLSVRGNFDLSHHPEKANLKEIKYDQSFLTIGISDLRGIKNQINFKWDQQNLSVKPGSTISNLAYSGVTVDLPDIKNKIGKKVNFEFLLNLRGSQNMSFVPIGSTTEVNLNSEWESPSFNGNFLPDKRELNRDGFNANWRILQLNRNFPQSWIETDQSTKMKEAAFGVDLLLPLDDYQKSMRSAKYAFWLKYSTSERFIPFNIFWLD